MNKLSTQEAVCVDCRLLKTFRILHNKGKKPYIIYRFLFIYVVSPDADSLFLVKVLRTF